MKKAHAMLGASLALAMPLSAESPKCPAPARPEARTLAVAVDPATGALRPPTSREAAQLVPARAPQGEIAVVTLPDGSRMIRLDARHRTSLVARVLPDGKIAVDCVRATAEVRR